MITGERSVVRWLLYRRRQSAQRPESQYHSGYFTSEKIKDMQLMLILKCVCVTDFIVDTLIYKSKEGPSFSVLSQHARDWGADERHHAHSQTRSWVPRAQREGLEETPRALHVGLREQSLGASDLSLPLLHGRSLPVSPFLLPSCQAH